MTAAGAGDPPRVDLRRTRDLGSLLGDALRLYAGRFWQLMAIAVAVELPVEVIVGGLAQRKLFSAYDPSPPPTDLLVPSVVDWLVTAPLIAAMVLFLLLREADGHDAGARAAILAGLEAFPALFLSMLLAALAVALGFVLLVVPGIFLMVRLYFVAQVVVVDGVSGPAALRRSWDLVQGSWWRVFGVVLLTLLIATVLFLLLMVPFDLAASAADSRAFEVAGTILVYVLVTPFASLVTALLFFDLRARRRAALAGAPAEGP